MKQFFSTGVPHIDEYNLAKIQVEQLAAELATLQSSLRAKDEALREARRLLIWMNPDRLSRTVIEEALRVVALLDAALSDGGMEGK